MSCLLLFFIEPHCIQSAVKSLHSLPAIVVRLPSSWEQITQLWGRGRVKVSVVQCGKSTMEHLMPYRWKQGVSPSWDHDANKTSWYCYLACAPERRTGEQGASRATEGLYELNHHVYTTKSCNVSFHLQIFDSKIGKSCLAHAYICKTINGQIISWNKAMELGWGWCQVYYSARATLSVWIVVVALELMIVFFKSMDRLACYVGRIDKCWRRQTTIRGNPTHLARH